MASDSLSPTTEQAASTQRGLLARYFWVPLVGYGLWRVFTQGDVAHTLIYYIALLIAFVSHELMHGVVANWFGDTTAKQAGRLTLNPLKHFDPLGTPLFLAIGFGWGKPVPLDPKQLNPKRVGEIVSALAGPFTNLAAAGLLLAVDHFFPFYGTPGVFFTAFLTANLLLGLFNLIPIPPLDGSHLYTVFFSDTWKSRFSTAGPFLLIAFLVGLRFLHI